ncbi:MAG: hypothetical protein QNK05_07650 [Myxococcota bacterium]|nr:hypothetical protein [Myxococcota bacterium]
MYFLRRSEAPQSRPEGVRDLRLSLNSPVITADDFPVGPSRAAILVHEEGDQRPNVTIAVRALKSGELAFWSYDGDLREESSVAVGVDGALSFGEGMGFLFDEPIADRERVLTLWHELLFDAPELDAPELDAPEPDTLEPEAREAEPAEGIAEIEEDDDDSDVLELLDALDEPNEPTEPVPAPESPAQVAPSSSPVVSVPGGVLPRSPDAEVLSKFRWAVPELDPARAEAAPEAPAPKAARADAAPETDEAPEKGRRWRKAPLAKLKLVKRKKQPRGVETRAWIQKLLTSF